MSTSGFSRRSFLQRAAITAALAGISAPIIAACSDSPKKDTGSGPIKIGVLFSLSGNLAISETAMHNAALMSIDEINKSGGVNGRQLEPVIEDYASDFNLVIQKAQSLINQGVAATVGCYSSGSRKAVLSVFEKANAVLVYPTFYEGLECSTNVIYSSLTANQHLTDASEWMVDNLGRNIYMVGSDYVGPQTYNAIVEKLTTSKGATIQANRLFPLGHTEFGAAISDIKAKSPDVVWCTLAGDSAPAFYKQFHAAGLRADTTPIMAGLSTEQELAAIGSDEAVGHYFPSSYFETISGNGNEQFVQAYKDRFGSSQPTNMPVQATYTSVKLIAAAITKAGSVSPEDILKAFPGVTAEAPGEGMVTVTDNHHTTHKIYLGKANSDKLYDVVATFEPRTPDPFPPNLVAAGQIPTCPRSET